MNNSAGSTRSAYFDVIRGCAIIMVVAIHSSSTGVQFLDHGVDDPNFMFTLVVRQVLICAVPVFVMLAGYFSPTARGDIDREGTTWKRLVRILVPYMVWSVVALVFAKASFGSGLLAIATGRALGPHYFIPAIVILIIFEFLVLRHIKHRWILAVGLAVSTLHILIAYVLHFAVPQLDWWYYMASPTAWLVYYSLGIFLRRSPPEIGLWPAVAAVAFILSVFEAYGLTLLLGVNSGAFEPIKLSTMLFSVSVCIVVVARRSALIKSAFLSWLGIVSFGIFLAHELVRGRLSTLIFRQVPALFEIQPAFQGAILAATMVTICVFAIACQRVLGTQRSKFWLGF
ncbi:acyltransferase [Devosia sediminis]|uniref:Acyltransferase n=1 Tax=Devosia sediminis TaxID=2798801 RepID=A0A934IVV0_9HYPH|nr:acyltransferase [Devosia sediminis]MBJ3784046.1 acyltransferase [Devosia sediminis]